MIVILFLRLAQFSVKKELRDFDKRNVKGKSVLCGKTRSFHANHVRIVF